jgi:DNA helicase HerA-like ATPase
MEIGQVIGATTLRSFRFVIKEGKEEYVKRDEFVHVAESVTGNKILGVVKDIVVSNELLPDEFSRDLRMSDLVLDEGEYPVPIVKILGIESKQGLSHPETSALIGHLSTRDSIPVYVSLNELVSRHTAILAMTGAGKSYTAGVLIEELMKKKGSVVVFDPHTEYTQIRFDNSIVKMYGLMHGDKIKAAASSLSTNDYICLIPDLTSTQIDLLDEVLDLVERFYDKYDLTTIMNVLSVVYDLKKNGKKEEAELDVFPPKHLKSITKKVTLATIGALMRRIRRIQRMNIFGMEGTPLEEICAPNQFTVINLAETDERISELIVSILCRQIFNARRKHVREGGGLDTPVLLLLEEAHNFAPSTSEGNITVSKSILKKIAREGRKFGVGLCLITQRPNKLDSDVLSQCNTQIIMKIVNPTDQEHIRQSVENVTEDIVNDLPGLNRGEAIVVGSAIKLPVPTKIRLRETDVGGQDIDIVGEWSRR